MPRAVILLLLALGLLEPAACTQQSSARPEPTYKGTINVGLATWTGYGVFFVASARNFWGQQQLDVNVSVVEDSVSRLDQLNSKHLQAAAAGVETLARAQSNGLPAVDVFPVDASVGGDAIVVRNGVNSVKDLQGKIVAVSQGSPSEWFLAQVLSEQGMSLSAVVERNMLPADAVSAFLQGRVDAVALRDPWLKGTNKPGFDHVLTSTRDHPQAVLDVLAFREDFAEDYPGSVRKFLTAYFQAFRWIQDNPGTAQQLIGEAVNESAGDVQSDLTRLTLLDANAGRQLMGTSKKHGRLYSDVKAAGQFWKEQGKVTNPVEADRAIKPDFLATLRGV
jgi:NitT/TauT family transport system substrate-binding protein